MGGPLFALNLVQGPGEAHEPGAMASTCPPSLMHWKPKIHMSQIHMLMGLGGGAFGR